MNFWLDKVMAMKFYTKILIAIGSLIVLWIGTSAFIVFFVARPVRIEGKAMMPGLNDRDRVLFRNRSAGDPLMRGDVVILYYPEDITKSYVKRVVGLPGEKIVITKEHVFINDKVLTENYLAQAEIGYLRPPTEAQIPAEHYFVLGDNRNFSSDSRNFGTVPDHLIYGKMLFRYAAAK